MICKHDLWFLVMTVILSCDSEIEFGSSVIRPTCDAKKWRRGISAGDTKDYEGPRQHSKKELPSNRGGCSTVKNDTRRSGPEM